MAEIIPVKRRVILSAAASAVLTTSSPSLSTLQLMSALDMFVITETPKTRIPQ